MRVPFVDLQSQYLSIAPEIDAAIKEVATSGHYLQNLQIKKFENAFAAKLGLDHCVGLSNGTDALLLILKALGIKAGDEVLTPAFSWISSASVISLLGAKPVLVDVDPDYFTIDLKKAEALISPRTKALIAVHLFGQTGDLPQIKNFGDEHNLFFIEDCAQAHFSQFDGVLAGTLGQASAFSFYPTKNLGAMGDAGCAVSKDEELATRIRRLANHGGLTKNEHLTLGYNSRMDEIQAAILRVKLQHIEAWNEQRVANAKLYRHALANIEEIQLPHLRPKAQHTYHQFVIKVKERDQLKQYLEESGIATDIHYPLAIPFEPAYAFLNARRDDFPVAYQLQHEVLSLPIVPEVSQEQILYVCKTIQDFYRK